MLKQVSPDKEFEMDVVGWVATVAVAAVVLAGVAIGLRSIPDVRRYLKIRNM
jgi:hypothetical protein